MGYFIYYVFLFLSDANEHAPEMSFARASVMGPVTGEGEVSTSGDLFCPAFATKHLPILLAYKKKKKNEKRKTEM